jgi:phosphoglycolate phosphatase/pyrophosphatase PpaX
VNAVLFDLDGTLTDTLPLVISSINAALAPVWGASRTPAEIRRLFGPPEGQLIADQAPADPNAIERFYAYYRRHHEREAKVFPGVRPMLSTLLARGFHLGLVTNKGHRSTMITLEAFGLRRFFRAVVDGDEVAPKPSPEGIRLALARLGARSEEAVYVGDMPSDLRAAKAAGVPGWAAAWSRPADPAEGWDFIALHPEDLLRRLGREPAKT